MNKNNKDQERATNLSWSDFKFLNKCCPVAKSLWLLLLLGCVLIFLKTFVDLSTPYITKLAIDNHIVPTALKLQKPALTDSDDIKKTWQLLEKYLSPTGNEKIFFLPATKRKHLDAKQNKLLRNANLISPHDYFVINKTKEEHLQIVLKYPKIIADFPLVLAFKSEDLKKISTPDILKLRFSNLAGLKFLALLALGLMLIGYLFDVGQRVILEVTAQRFSHQLRQNVLKHVLKQKMAFFDQQKTGILVSRLTSDVHNLAEMVKSFASTFFSDLFLLAGVTTVMLILSPRLTLLSMVLMPFIIALSFYFSKLSRNVQRRLRARLAEINHTFSEALNGLAIIKVFSREKHNQKLFDDLNKRNYRAGLDQVKISALFLPLVDFFASLALAIIIWFGGLAVIDDKLTLGIVAAFVGYSRQFFMPIRDLAEKVTIFQAAAVSLERLVHILETNEILPENPNPQKIIGRGKIEFKNVNFSYQPKSQVLYDINFKVRPGQVLALVGATGSGKSSITNLLLRFYDIDSGNILVDDQDIRELDLSQHRKRISLVSQDVYLHSGTVMDNLKLGRPDVTDSAAIKAATVVGANHFIEKLPHKYNELLGPGGRSLSSGQRQLLSCARAFIQAPQLVVFDEATAFVDSEAEQLIDAALSDLFAGRTAIVIAHRLSTIRHADRILVLNQGQVVEDGSHEELLALNSYYADLATLQGLNPNDR